MIRLLFVLFITLGGFAAAAIWNLRSDGPAERIVSPELRTTLAAEVDQLGLARLAEKLPLPRPTVGEAPTAPKPQPQAPQVKEPESAAPALSASGTTKPATTTATDRTRGKDEPVRSGAGGSLAANDPAADHAPEVEVIAPLAEFARDFGAGSDRGMETTSDTLPIDPGGTAVRPNWHDDSPNHDADRSAKLIRRMLAVYRSHGSSR